MNKTHTPPTEIRVTNGGKLLHVTFSDAEEFDFTAELLRVESPSAEVQGHSAAEKRTIAGKLAVTIGAVEPIGNYAVRIVFSDGHDTGIFTWEYFNELGKNKDRVWADYLGRLQEFNLSRE